MARRRANGSPRAVWVSWYVLVCALIVRLPSPARAYHYFPESVTWMTGCLSHHHLLGFPRLLQAEREARDEQTSEILMVLDALREEVARTNANLEARSAPDALYQAISQSGQMSAQSRAIGQHQEQLERLTSASALIAEELTKFDATDTTNSVSSKLDEISTRFDRLGPHCTVCTNRGVVDR